MDCDWRPRSFEIELHNRMNVDDILAHFYMNCGTFINTSRVILRTKVLIAIEGHDHSDTDYSDQPWEVEAREMERKLLHSYLGLGPKSHGKGTPFPNRLTAS